MGEHDDEHEIEGNDGGLHSPESLEAAGPNALPPDDGDQAEGAPDAASDPLADDRLLDPDDEDEIGYFANRK